MKKIVVCCIMSCIMMFSFMGCNMNKSTTALAFLFHTSKLADSSDEKVIYFNDSYEKLNLDAKLKIDAGSILVEIISPENNEIVWSNTYEEDSEFKIELENIIANSEYKIRVQTKQSKNISLEINSSVKLVKDKEKIVKPTK